MRGTSSLRPRESHGPSSPSHTDIHDNETAPTGMVLGHVTPLGRRPLTVARHRDVRHRSRLKFQDQGPNRFLDLFAFSPTNHRLVSPLRNLTDRGNQWTPKRYRAGTSLYSVASQASQAGWYHPLEWWPLAKRVRPQVKHQSSINLCQVSPRQCSSLFFNTRVKLCRMSQHVWCELLPFHSAPTVWASTGLAVPPANQSSLEVAHPWSEALRFDSGAWSMNSLYVVRKLSHSRAVGVASPSCLQNTVLHFRQMVAMISSGSEVSLRIPCWPCPAGSNIVCRGGRKSLRTHRWISRVPILADTRSRSYAARTRRFCLSCKWDSKARWQCSSQDRRIACDGKENKSTPLGGVTNLRRKAWAEGCRHSTRGEKSTHSGCLPALRWSCYCWAIWRVRCARRSRKSLMRFLRRATARAYESLSPTRCLLPRDRSWLIKCGAVPFRCRKLHSAIQMLGLNLRHSGRERLPGTSHIGGTTRSFEDFQPAGVSIGVFSPQGLERVQQKLPLWCIYTRTGTNSPLQLIKKGVSNAKKMTRCFGTQVCPSTLKLRSMPWAKRFVRTTSMRVSASPEKYVGAGHPVCCGRRSHPSSTSHPRRKAPLIWSSLFCRASLHIANNDHWDLTQINRFVMSAPEARRCWQ